ncbi:PRC-barrel domain-containing protein [Streptomyces sp. H10-C2]|uniref:PRC-barrel domain-containing protein n=1 Tax=unclassified Streptomyces TaxID=2593676 RepID=UPI0024B9995B|nr:MULTISPECIES: PRC-barrel domain-containing protein [unclassified Streptomyces]MDJ0342311.1 PRC-barrel domain-containing protein [Streptomyces sp. PH10-H1]MDJ0372166.1 PRC-barrel domain-containing protein [Streptomyces sp. H10-C2]
MTASTASTLMLASEITKRPVLTLDGEAVAQVKDIVFEGTVGRIAGFTLSGRGLLSGPLRHSLPWSGVHGLGRAAVMIRSEDVFESRADVLGRGAPSRGDVLGSRVLTDGGTDLGRISDVVVEVVEGTTAHVIGYEIASSEALGRQGRKVFIPLSETTAVSGEALVIPAAAAEFIADDLPGFAAAVQAYRARRSTEV